MPTVQAIDSLKLLDIVLLIPFTKFKNIAFSWNGSDLNFFLFGILQDFCDFFSILYYSGVLEDF